MIVKVDYREKRLINSLTSLINNSEEYSGKIMLESVNLLLGDICICNDDGSELIIIERKTLNDLESSIKDTRYREQSMRLNHHTIHNHYIMYIIEGDRSVYQTHKSEREMSTLYSAMFSLYYYKGFSILCSQCVSDTAEIIFNFSKKYYRESREKNNKLPYYTIKQQDSIENSIDNNEDIGEIIGEITSENNVEIINSPNSDYLQCIKMQKRDNINKDNIWTIMLMQIPFISSTIATVILERYKTIPTLVTTLRENENCLDDLFTMSKEKKRKIPSNVINNLKSFLL